MQSIKTRRSRRISKRNKNFRRPAPKYETREPNRHSFKIENNPKELARLIAERLRLPKTKYKNSSRAKPKSMYSKVKIFDIKETGGD